MRDYLVIQMAFVSLELVQLHFVNNFYYITKLY